MPRCLGLTVGFPFVAGNRAAQIFIVLEIAPRLEAV